VFNEAVPRCVLHNFSGQAHICTQCGYAEFRFLIGDFLQELIQRFVIDRQDIHLPEEWEDVLVVSELHVLVADPRQLIPIEFG
jgi:hypothetical protein